MRTETFVDLPSATTAPRAAASSRSLHHGEALGRASWYMGYRPSYLALRALYRARREPAALAMLWGYAGRGAHGASRAAPTARVVDALRERQRLRVALRRGAPAS